MKNVPAAKVKAELKTRSQQELLDLLFRLSRFKRENKELLTYLLFDVDDEAGFIEKIKEEVVEDFSVINTVSYFYIKKSVRKILKNIKKYIRYSRNKETEVELLLFFCEELKSFSPSIKYNPTLTNLYNRQIEAIKKKVALLHEDLQYDYEQELNELVL